MKSIFLQCCYSTAVWCGRLMDLIDSMLIKNPISPWPKTIQVYLLLTGMQNADLLCSVVVGTSSVSFRSPGLFISWLSLFWVLAGIYVFQWPKGGFYGQVWDRVHFSHILLVKIYTTNQRIQFIHRLRRKREAQKLTTGQICHCVQTIVFFIPKLFCPTRLFLMFR